VAISAVRDAYKTEKKILLDVKLDSPQLIFVKSSLSPEALVLDLGNLIVKNKLEGVPTSTSRTAVLDGMDVMLEGLCVSRCAKVLLLCRRLYSIAHDFMEFIYSGQGYNGQ